MMWEITTNTMTEVVAMDKAGRIVLPKAARKRLGLKAGSRFVVAELEEGRLLLLPLDVEALAKRLMAEFEGFDIDAATERVRDEVEALGAKRYPGAARGRRTGRRTAD